MTKKIIALCLITNLALFAQETQIQEEHSPSTPQQEKSKKLIDKIKEKEKELAVSRDTVPVEESKFLVDTPIPKTAQYLPLLQTLLNIKPGTLSNPIGVSVIGSYTHEKYKIKQFNGMLGRNIGQILCRNPSIAPPEYRGMLKLACGFNNIAPDLGSNMINQSVGAGEIKEWQLSEGTVDVKTGAVGVKIDAYILPFMNLFFTTAYLNVQQSTNVGIASVPMKKTGNPAIDKLIPAQMPFPVGTLENKLDGWLVMGGTNLAIGYKGFFASCMISGGFVRLDDLKNNIKGFVEKPFMYIAPRIGYSYHGVFTIHTGIQRIELFGNTKGSDLSKLTGGLVESFSTEIEKFPVTFLAGAQFMFMRDFGVSVEYVGSPDTNGINAEIAYRF